MTKKEIIKTIGVFIGIFIVSTILISITILGYIFIREKVKQPTEINDNWCGTRSGTIRNNRTQE